MRGEPPKAKQGWGGASTVENVTAVAGRKKSRERGMPVVTGEGVGGVVGGRGECELESETRKEACAVDAA